MSNLSLKSILLVGLGGAIGGGLRFTLIQIANTLMMTIVINVLGALGLVYLTYRMEINETQKLFYATGVLGSFTTFSGMIAMIDANIMSVLIPIIVVYILLPCLQGIQK